MNDRKVMEQIKKVVALFWYFKQTRITLRVNGLLFYLRKAPIIGKYFPVIIYREYRLKRMLFYILFILEILGKIAAKFIWLLLPMVILEFSAGGLVIWWVLTTLIMAFYTEFSFTIDRGQVDFTRFYQLSRVQFLQSAQIIPIFIDCLAYLPAAFLVGWLIQRPFATVLFVLLSYAAGYFLMMVFGRLLFKLTQRSVPRMVIGSLIGLGFASLLVKILMDGQQEKVMEMLLHPLMIMLYLAIFLGSFWLSTHFKDTQQFFEVRIQKTDAVYLKADQAKSSSYVNEGLKMQDALVLDESVADDKLAHLQGSAYLNRLLFSRYRKQLDRALYYRIALFVAVMMGIGLLRYFDLLSKLTENQTIQLFPLLFFFMYLLTLGKKIVQMVYINCDSAMLYYPFYREKSAVLSGFYARFKETLRYNSLIVAGFLLIFAEIHVLNHFSFSYRFFLLLILLLVSLAFLFSFHELFVYYLLQPFSSDLETVNPVYKWVQYVFYLIAYMNMQMPVGGFLYIMFVCISVAIYVVVGWIVIQKFAPKTFKIK